VYTFVQVYALPSRYASERLSEPIAIFTLTLVEPVSLLILEPPSAVKRDVVGAERVGCSINSLQAG
jgi:hypothetical protein